MRIQQLLEHHGVLSNPFAEEDAQTDPVFKQHCIATTRHPSWDKVYGDPAEPSTSLVFGEKGAGKTALRLQIVRQLAGYNQTHPDRRLFVVEYDDFNPFLDRFAQRFSSRKRVPERVLGQWKLWDHMDAILALGATQLIDRGLGRAASENGTADSGPLDFARLDRSQARDLLLLAACYDRGTSETSLVRWNRLRKTVRFATWKARWQLPVAGLVLLAVVAWLLLLVPSWSERGAALASPWPYLFVAAGFLPWVVRAWLCLWRARAITRNLRVIHRDLNPLRKILMHFTSDELANQPLPVAERTDDRYELLAKLQGLLRGLGYAGIIVVVDRVDEPHLLAGAPQSMKAFLWSMLDNKFLKHPGLGFKLLLPIELSYYIEREDREFYQRARLDKQNMIPSLEWTGEALYDVANARLQACAAPGQRPTLRALFEDSVSDRRLIDALRLLRVPRNLFKFLYRVLSTHCNQYTEDSPRWQIPAETFESVLALYQRDQDAFERGLGAG